MKKIMRYLLCAAFALSTGLVGCTDDEQGLLDSAVLYESITMEFSEDVMDKFYTDATSTQVLPMLIGENAQIGYSTTPAPSEVTLPNVVWSSSNPSVLSVADDGVISALSAGTAIVTLKSEAPNLVAQATLKVLVVPQLVPATSISLTNNATMLDPNEEYPAFYVGETTVVTATIEPADATYQSVRFSSSDESIATVDRRSGVVTGVSRGYVDIIATALDPQNPVSATTHLYVDQIVQPIGIKLGEVETLHSMSEPSYTIPFTTYPEVSTLSLIEWSSSDESVAKVNGGVVTFVKYGNVTITGKCTADEAAPEGYASTVNIQLNIPAGYYNEHHIDPNQLWWTVPNTAGATATRKQDPQTGEYYMHVIPGVQNADNWRGDLRRGPTNTELIYLAPSSYPILCFRFDDAIDKGAANRSIFVDTNNGYVDNSGSTERIWSGRIGGGGAQKWAKKYTCSDGSCIIFFNIAEQSWQNGGNLTENAVAVFNVFTLGYADVRTFATAEDASYRFFWFHTFQSEAELNKYLNDWSARTGITFE